MADQLYYIKFITAKEVENLLFAHKKLNMDMHYCQDGAIHNRLTMDTAAITTGYKTLVIQISETYLSGQQKAIAAVNTSMVETYWKIGEYIIRFEQHGNTKASYGKTLLKKLSTDLKMTHGKGFSMSNIYLMRQFFLKYPIFQTVSGKLASLSWSHFCELIPIEDELERGFYEMQCQIENWNVRELKRQKKASLFLRLAASKDKEGILALAHQGQLVQQPTDLIRDPYIFDFLKIPEPYAISETDLEKRLIDQLQAFLLELGKGFAFIARQYRITLGNTPYYVDLVFYHRILKCFVLIDLKKGKAGYEDLGQMNMYLGYMENEENTEGDKPPIGIVLAREKDDLLIKYAMHNVSSQLFISKYQLYLPNKEELQAVITRTIEGGEKNR